QRPRDVQPSAAPHQSARALRPIRDHRRRQPERQRRRRRFHHRRPERSAGRAAAQRAVDRTIDAEPAVEPHLQRENPPGGQAESTVVMDWMNWKTWTIIGLAIVAIFAIYTFAATNRPADPPVPTAPRPVQRVAGKTPPLPAMAPGIGVIHTEWLEMQSGSYQSKRNLFSYV